MPILHKILLRALKLNNQLLFFASVVLVFCSSFIIYTMEPETFTSLFHALWWVMTTVTTVGYGDVYPTTVSGRVFAMFLYVIGIGLIGVVIGKVVDSFSSFRKKREEGKLMYKKEQHIVIIGWSRKAQLAIREILASNKTIEIVIIDTLEKAPILDDRVHYVHGEASEDKTLEQANMLKARAVLIFGDETLYKPELIDGKTLLIVTAIERFSDHIHTTVEIMDERHVRNFRFVNVDEFILPQETVSRLAVRSALMDEISTIYSQLLSRQQGDDLYHIERQKHWKTYRDAFEELLREGATLIADRGKLNINRRLDEEIPEDAQLYVICDEKTYNKILQKRSMI